MGAGRRITGLIKSIKKDPMKRFVFFMLITVAAASCSHTYYVVRHAEKVQAQPPLQDPPLTPNGEAMAQNLKNILLPKGIKHIFSTNTTRTKSTAAPLSEAAGISVEIYSKPDEAFITKLKALKKNTLVVGHSNTVDDIVNALCNTTKINGDLPDADYGDLFVVTVKGKKIYFKKLRY
jgi:phosphohistidine phosphatase SixA